MDDVVSQLQAAQEVLEPQAKALRKAVSALKSALRLASDEQADALPMQKALLKLEVAAEEVESEALTAAIAAFAQETSTALDNLAFDFARDLRQAFAEREVEVNGRPPTLIVDPFTFEINMGVRKGQWFYGKEALTRPIPLSLKGILKAYDRQVKRIVMRDPDMPQFLDDLRQAWQNCLDKRSKKPSDGRMNIIEVYAELILNRQGNRFWNSPARRTFKDYEREYFVRDLVLARERGAAEHFRLGVATKSQAEQASRSIWIPDSPTDGQYYSDITFSDVALNDDA